MGDRGLVAAGPSRDSSSLSQSESDDDGESVAKSGMRADSMQTEVEWDSERESLDWKTRCEIYQRGFEVEH